MKQLKILLVLTLIFAVLLSPSLALAAATENVANDGSQITPSRLIHHKYVCIEKTYYSTPPDSIYYEEYDANYGCWLSGVLDLKEYHFNAGTGKYSAWYHGTISGGTL